MNSSRTTVMSDFPFAAHENNQSRPTTAPSAAAGGLSRSASQGGGGGYFHVPRATATDADGPDSDGYVRHHEMHINEDVAGSDFSHLQQHNHHHQDVDGIGGGAGAAAGEAEEGEFSSAPIIVEHGTNYSFQPPLPTSGQQYSSRPSTSSASLGSGRSGRRSGAQQQATSQQQPAPAYTARSVKPGYYPIRTISAVNDSLSLGHQPPSSNDAQPGHDVVHHHANCPPGGFWWCQHCRRHQQGVWPQQLVPQPPGRNGYFTGHDHAASLLAASTAAGAGAPPHTTGGGGSRGRPQTSSYTSRPYHSKEQQLQMKSAEAFPKAGGADIPSSYFVVDDDISTTVGDRSAADASARTAKPMSAAAAAQLSSRSTSNVSAAARQGGPPPASGRSKNKKGNYNSSRGGSRGGSAMLSIAAPPRFNKRYPVWHTGPGGQLRCSARGRVYFSRTQAIAEGWEGGLPSVLPNISNPLATRQKVTKKSSGQGHRQCPTCDDPPPLSVIDCPSPNTCGVCFDDSKLPVGHQYSQQQQQQPNVGGGGAGGAVAAGLAAATRVEGLEGGHGEDLGLFEDGVRTLQLSHRSRQQGSGSNNSAAAASGRHGGRGGDTAARADEHPATARPPHKTLRASAQDTLLSIYEQRHDFSRKEARWVKAKGDTMAAPTRGRAYFSLGQAKAERWERGLPAPLQTVGGRWQPCARRNGWGETPVNNF